MSLRLLHRFFEEGVARHAERPALRMGDRALSYRELDEQSNRLAGALISQGARPEVPIGVLLRRSIDTIVAALAVLKSGSYLVPLEARDPRQRIALILGDTRPPVVLVHRELAELVTGTGANVLAFDVAAELAAAAPAPRVDIAEDNLAYVIYTSGSTGRPKGVAMPHRGIAGILDHTIETSRADASWRTMQFAALGFDIFFQECFTTWATGGVIELVDDTARGDPRELAALVARTKAERIFLPYVALRQLAEAITADRVELPALREVYTAGEQLVVTPELRAWFARHPSCVLYNHYGPTEAHVVSTLEVAGPPGAWPERPSIGKPIRGVALRLLDGRGELVGDGQDGEIFVAGNTLARGYLGGPSITAQRFVPDPSSHGARLYRTGDIGRTLEDGSIQFLGRADHQIKVRGFRVELGEIEAALVRHPAVRQALVVARAGTDSTSMRLAAYVCPRGDARPSEEVAAWLRDTLPDYMQPSVLVWMQELPQTAHGKVDLSALPDPADQPVERDGAAPLPGVERELAVIWSELLGVARVMRDDSFFELGGHSLLAAQLASRASKLFGRKLAIRDITLTPVLREQAVRFAQVEAAPADGATSDADTIFQYVRALPRDEASRQLATWEPEPEDDTVELPFGKGALIRLAPDARRLLRILMREHARDLDVSLPVRRRVRADGRSRTSDVQRILWDDTQRFNARPEPGRVRWGIGLCMSQDIQGPLDVPVLTRALDELQQRHEILRSRFATDANDVLWQQVASATPLVVEDLQHLPEDQRLAEARRRYDELYASWDLTGAGPLKLRLLRLAPERYVLVILLNHIAFDAFSFGIVASAVEQLYDAGVRGQPMDLAAQPYQYADMIQRRHDLATRPVGLRARKYWSTKLDGAKAIEVATLADPESGDNMVQQRLDARLGEAVRAAASRINSPAWMLLFHAYSRVVAEHYHCDSLFVINAYAGRERSGADGVIGPLFRPLPIHVKGIFDDCRDAIEYLQNAIAETREHADLSPSPLEMGDLTRVNFNYIPGDVNAPADTPEWLALRLEGLRCTGLDWAWEGDRTSTLKALVTDAGVGFDFLWPFNPLYLRRAQVEQLAAAYAAYVPVAVSALMARRT